MKKNLYYQFMLINQQIYYHQTFYQINYIIYTNLDENFILFHKNHYFRQNLIIFPEQYLIIDYINLFIIHNFGHSVINL